MNKSKKTILSLAFASAAMVFMALPQTSHAETLDEGVATLVESVKNNDLDGALKSWDRIGSRLGELGKMANDAAKQAEAILEPAKMASKVLASEAIELQDIVEMVNADTETLNKIKPQAPKFKNLMDGISEQDLKSSDAATRKDALDKAIMQGETAMAEYETAYEALKEKQAQAEQAYKEARDALKRGIALGKQLEDLNNSKAGLWLNAYGGQLAFMVLDVELHLKNALTERRNAARELVERYNDSLSQMDKVMESYELLRDWLSFYSWQELAILSAEAREAEKEAANVFDIGEDLKNAKKSFDRSKELADEADAINAPSRQSIRIQALIDKTVRDTGVSREKARKLIEEANEKDRKLYAAQQFSMLMSMASSVASLSGQPSGGETAASQTVPQEPPSNIQGGGSGLRPPIVLPRETPGTTGTNPPVVNPPTL